jgi:pimeloyl-ACP methyl ester carboxylesterase
MLRPDRRTILAGLPSLAALGLSGCGAGEAALADLALAPAATRKPGHVFLFPGLTLPGDSYHGTMTDRMAHRLRAAGVGAEVNYASTWRSVAERVAAATPQYAAQPLAVVGYSYGGHSATEFARMLGAADLPIETLVTIEATDPTPIAATVARAVNIYLGGGFLSKLIAPDEGFSGSLENIPINRVVEGGESLADHWSMSRAEVVFQRVLGELIDENGVRRRSPRFQQPAAAPTRTPRAPRG